ncbi:MAG: hypothetical protein CMP20_09385 [Rickettsiales bacterium]|nr:hypothetical protein [Rickettsiales bacterium]
MSKTKKRNRETRKTKGPHTISAKLDHEIENVYGKLAEDVKGLRSMIKMITKKMTVDTDISEEELTQQLFDRLRSTERKTKKLQYVNVDPPSEEPEIPSENFDEPIPKRSKALDGTAKVTLAHPYDSLQRYINSHDVDNCLTMPMLQDCGLDEHSLRVMSPQDAVAYHIVLRTTSFLVTIIDFDIIDSNPQLAYAQNYEIAVYILISYLLRRHPSIVNPAETGTNEMFIESLAALTAKILAYTNLSSFRQDRIKSFIRDVCLTRWQMQHNLLKTLTQSLASHGSMRHIINCLVDASDIRLRKPKWTDDSRDGMCVITQSYVPGKDLVELSFLPGSHTDCGFTVPIREELGAALYGLFISFNLPWILLRSNQFLVKDFPEWLCTFTAVLRYADEQSATYLLTALNQLVVRN